MKKLFYVIIAGVILAGCATSHKMNNVSLGMTKAEVIKVLGTPTSTSANAGMEYLMYDLYTNFNNAFDGLSNNYFVRIIDGKVEAYGELGDFDSTKAPEETINLNIKNSSQ